MWKGSILDSSQTYDMWAYIIYIYIILLQEDWRSVVVVFFLFDNLVERFFAKMT